MKRMVIGMTDRQYFFRMFRFVKPYAFTYSIGTFIYSAQGYAFALMSSIFLGAVTAAIMNASFSDVLDAILLVVIMLVGISILLGAGTYLYIVSIGYGRRDVSISLFRAFMKSSMETQAHSGEGIAALNTDINTATDIFSNALTPFLMSLITASFSIVTVFALDWRMGIGALTIGLLALFVQSRFAAPLAELGKARLETTADSVKSLSSILAGALTIRAYNRQDRALIQFDKESGKLKTLAFKQAFLGMWQDLFTTVQGGLTIMVVFVLGGFLVIRGEMEFARIMMILSFAQAISSAMSQIGSTFAALHPPIVAAKRIFGIIDSVQNDRDDGDDSSANKFALSHKTGNYDININKLSFSYKDAAGEALKDIDLSIKENKMIAFVGESGSGKSTLLRAIIGMYERDGFDMKIGDLSFNSCDVQVWRSHFAYVDQSCKLFDMSIMENIAMGKKGEAGDEQVVEAAKRAIADEFISALPDGYSTACGEKGASLSGGQKQRIAIARALCKEAPVLVFDEATSALDTDSERKIMETVENLRSDHTILITTHKLSNITTADKIVVMDGGRIAESGTHVELLEKGGLYKKLFEENHTV